MIQHINNFISGIIKNKTLNHMKDVKLMSELKKFNLLQQKGQLPSI